MENKFSAKALMLCPICNNSYYSELEVTVKDNNGDIVHLDICSSAAPIKKEPFHICGVNDEINSLARVLWKLEIIGHIGYCADYWVPLARKIYDIGYRLPKEIKKNET